MLSERKLPAARINLFSSFHFLVFIESHVLPLLHEENAPFPVHQEDYSHQKAHQMGVWKQQMEKLSWNEQRFNRYCVLSIGSYEVRKCLFIWKCHRCYYTLLRLFRRVNCVVTEQRSGCIISCLSAPVFFFFFLSFFFQGMLGLSFCSAVIRRLYLLKGLQTHTYSPTGRDRQRTPTPPNTDTMSQQRIDITSALRW